MFAAFFLAFYWGVATFRSYYRSIQTFYHQLLNFRLQDTKCHCCTRGHIAEDGSRMPCDREIVEGCICNWFGSVQKFEEFIAPLLRSTFENQLGQHQFPYSYFLVIFCPAAWLAMDLSVGAAEPGYIARYEKDYWSVFWFFQLLGIWLGTMPSISKLASGSDKRGLFKFKRGDIRALYLTQCFCAPRRYLICDVFLNVMIVSLLNFCFYLFLHTTRFFNDKHNSPLNDLDISMTARAILMFVTWFLLFSMPEVLKLIRSRHKKRSSQDATQVFQRVSAKRL
ncbi:unnamed protein product [Symbiodinium natans]|uniref:Uncharacterized protein n=1 Tax=Symbiodinium natans TaxID=878477 RepID=A0A812JK45_9DINO|nr:unnamed protein product [Symbiodinium natans]